MQTIVFAGVAGELSCHISSVAAVSGETLLSKAIRETIQDFLFDCYLLDNLEEERLDFVDSVLIKLFGFFSCMINMLMLLFDKLYYCHCLLQSPIYNIYVLVDSKRTATSAKE